MVSRISISSLFILMIGLVLQSCGTSGFNKQKYTKLQKIKPSYEEQSSEESGSIEDSDALNYTSSISDAEEEYIVTVEEEVDEIDFVEETEEIEIVSKPTDSLDYAQRDRGPGNRNDFEKLKEHHKNQLIVDFNRQFNTTLFFFMFGFAFGLISFVSLFFLIGLGVMWVIAWIYSMVAMTRLKRIDKAKYHKNLRTRITWMQILQWAGILICIGTLTPGLILLIIWLSGGI